MIFMGMWVIVNWWVWSVPDFHFRKLEAMYICMSVGMYVCRGPKSEAEIRGPNARMLKVSIVR